MKLRRKNQWPKNKEMEKKGDEKKMRKIFYQSSSGRIFNNFHCIIISDLIITRNSKRQKKRKSLKYPGKKTNIYQEIASKIALDRIQLGNRKITYNYFIKVKNFKIKIKYNLQLDFK